jgi:hypothetical protein
MIFQTESGSSYELDPANKKIRRLSGGLNPTPRQGPDGEWKEYHSISIPTFDEELTIVWRMEGSIAKATLTSRIVSLSTDN